MKKIVMLLLCLPLLVFGAKKVIFDFEDDKILKDCMEVVESAKTPEPKIEFSVSDKNAAFGSKSLKLVFDGGYKPCLAIKIPEENNFDFLVSPAFVANVFVERTCVVGFRLAQEGVPKGKCWEKLARLEPGMNKVEAVLYQDEKAGKTKELQIYMFCPKKRETIYLDDIGVSTKNVRTEAAYSQYNPIFIAERGFLSYDDARLKTYPKLDRKIKILGAGIEAETSKELYSKIKSLKAWPPPVEMTVEQAEKEFKDDFERIKKEKPGAVMAIFRYGDAGFDPEFPSKKYSGWADAELQGHDPAAGYANFAMNCRGKNPSSELFLRRRCCLMKADISTIPAASVIIKATLMLVRAGKASAQQYGGFASAVWIAEPCARPWVEDEVNCVEYAKDKFWKEIDGMYWSGDDPDFLPLIIAYQIGSGYDGAQRWDFTEAVKYWADRKNQNNGFCLYTLHELDYMKINTKEAAEVKDRPAMMIIYEPK